MNIFIGCGSEEVDEKYTRNSIELVEKLSKLPNINLVFGAYNHGMMGIVYDLFRKNNKDITGITLDCYKEQLKELECSKEIVVETSMDRMREIYKNSDILLFLPGGIGTYTEILCSIEEHRSKEDDKKLILYNDEFFYTPLIKELYNLYQNKFSTKNVSEYISVESDKEEIIKILKKESR